MVTIFKKNIQYYNILLWGIFFVLSIILFVFNWDYWDGSVIQNGVSHNNLSTIKEWLFSSGWHFQYFFIKVLWWISTFTHIPFNYINDCVIIGSLALLIIESKKIYRNIFNASNLVIKLSQILLILSPLLSLLLTSVLTFQFFTFTISLYVLRKLFETNNKAYLIPLVLCFSYKSLLVFIPCLSLLYSFKTKNYLYTAYILLMAIVFFLIYKLYFPTYGFYIGYNEINIKNLNNNLAHFLISLQLVCLPISIIIFSSVIIFFKKKIKLDFSVIQACILFLAAILPYVLVLKSSYFFRSGYLQWGSRFYLITFFVVPFIYATSVKYIRVKLLRGLIQTFYITLSGFLLFSSLLSKYEQFDYRERLVKKLLKENLNNIGYVYLEDEKNFTNIFPHIRFYTINYDYSLVSNDSIVILFSNKKKNISFVKKNIEQKTFRKSYNLQYPKSKISATYKVVSNGYNSKLDLINSSFKDILRSIKNNIFKRTDYSIDLIKYQENEI